MYIWNDCCLCYTYAFLRSIIVLSIWRINVNVISFLCWRTCYMISVQDWNNKKPTTLEHLVGAGNDLGSKRVTSSLLIVCVDDEADCRSKDVDKHHQKRAYVQCTKHTARQYHIRLWNLNKNFNDAKKQVFVVITQFYLHSEHTPP